MSTRHTAVPLQMYPAQGSYLSLAGASSWANPAWTEVFAATTNAVYIAGVASPGSLGAGRPIEFEFAVGPSGQEEVIHTYRLEYMYQTNTPTNRFFFPVPLGNIPPGVRLSMRVRSFVGTAPQVTLMYYENLETQHKTAAPVKCWPYRDESIEVTWASGAWAWSDWYNINPLEDVDQEITLLDVSLQPSTSVHCAAEVQVSRGNVGEEELYILTTKRFLHSPAAQPFIRLVFPGGFPVSAGTRLSFRVRRADPWGTPQISHFSWNYVYHTTFLS